MKHKSFAKETCAIARSLNVVGEWWNLLIVREAFSGITKFADFQKRLGIARNILTVRLRQLVDDGILQMGKNGGELVRRDHSWARKGEFIQGIYSKLFSPQA